jgi:predicted O-methyltransferase YrrM
MQDNGILNTAGMQAVISETKKNYDSGSFSIEYAKQLSLQNEVPVIFDGTRDILTAALKKYKPKRILEIGGGMGYSGLVILSASAPQKFVSVEKNESRYLVLKQVIAERGGTAVWDDAYNAMANLIAGGEPDGVFDFIFLDGPKGQYGKYFNLIHKLLARGGVIFADNIDFHGMVSGKIPTTTGARSIVNGLRDFTAKLKMYKYNIEQLPDGDGIIIAEKT